MNNSDKVSFFIGGAQKCGTTALFMYMREHPEVFFPEIKEIHYFDDEVSVNWDRPDYSVYHAHFDGRHPLVMADATPIYIYWPESLERIARYNPDARMVFLFRDPSERAYSHWKMETARGFDSVPFSWAIREGRNRVHDPKAPNHHRVFSYVERGFYGRQMERVYSLFPKNSVLNLRSSDLARDPDSVLRQVCRHIGVADPNLIQKPLFANVGPDEAVYPKMTQEDADYLSALFADDMALFEKISGLKLRV